MRYFLRYKYLASFVCIASVTVTAGGSIKKNSLLSPIVRNNATIVPVSTSGLYWNNLSVQDAKGKFLLHNFSGRVENGHVCGILGPSGAGKTCTLSSIGGTISSSSGLQVNGESFYYDKEKKTKENLEVKEVAFMQQNDNFFEMLTVQETLQLASFLELPFSERQRQRQVKSMMGSLDLVRLKDRRVGDSATGLSGGEKRRLSLALELVSTPKLFLADEPSSGLDSTMSEKVVGLIKKLVKQRNIPCIISLHQPRSSIFKMLNSLILLGPKGLVVYHGEACEAISYFANLGFICPPQTNPSEWLIDLVSIDSEDATQTDADELRVTQLAVFFAESQKSLYSIPNPIKDIDTDIDIEIQEISTIKEKNLKDLTTNPSKKSFRAIKVFGRLLLRSWRQNIRNNRVNAFRLFASGGNAYLFTRIFHSIKKGSCTARSVADRVALLSFSVINMSMMALLKTIGLFAKEKPVVLREQQRHQYSSLEYLLAKFIAEIPLDVCFAAIFTSTLKSLCGLRIELKALTGVFTLATVALASIGMAIGACSPTGEIAMVTGIPIMVIFMTVGVINPAGVDKSDPQPMLVKVLKQFSPISFAIKALCLAEYRGMEFDNILPGKQNKRSNIFMRGKFLMKELPKMGALALVKNGDQVLDELGLGEDSYEGAMRHLAIISFGNLFLSWIGLTIHSKSK